VSETTQAPAEVGTLGGRPAPTRRGQRYFVPNGSAVDAYESLDGLTWTAVGGAAAIPSGTYVPSDPVVALTYNGDGTVATTTRLAVTRTYTYSGGDLTAVA
jgi:hypothetical protein